MKHIEIEILKLLTLNRLNDLETNKYFEHIFNCKECFTDFYNMKSELDENTVESNIEGSSNFSDEDFINRDINFFGDSTEQTEKDKHIDHHSDMSEIDHHFNEHDNHDLDHE